MDLTRWLLHRASPRPFVVTAIGGTRVRLAAERELRRRAWQGALSPAEADVLLVCGQCGPELAEAVDALWDQVPGPRARVWAASDHDVSRALDEARSTLVDSAAQRRDASTRTASAEEQESARSDGEPAAHHPSGTSSPPAGLSGPDAHDMHAGHDMHGGGMDLPGGLPMADRGADRDGLTLDRLHIRLGPALPDWQAGLRVSLTIQGDVVQEAAAAIVDPASARTPRFWSAPATDTHERPDRRRIGAAAALDDLQRLLAVAGWADASTTARRLRDELLDPDTPGSWRRTCTRWSRSVRRSRMLRWSTDGLGVIADHGPPALQGDATARWNRWLDAVDALALPREVEEPPADGGGDRAAMARAALDALPSLLVGRELAAVRLIVASLGLDLESLGAHRGKARHG